MDGILVRRTLHGDKAAFSQLVAKYQTQVYGLALSMSGDFSDAEDLAQEAFLHAYVSLHRLREPAKFGNWLYKITQNICRRWAQRKTNYQKITQFVRRNEHIPMPDELTEAKELQERVREAIDQLPEHESLVITLYYIDGLTCRDIADFAGVSESTVKRRLRSSREKLKGDLIAMVQENLPKHNPTSEFTEKVAFETENLEAAIRDAVDKHEGPILKADLGKLTRLGAQQKHIANLSGVEHCTQLEGLWIGGNQISDLNPLSELTDLQILSLGDNQIADLTPLGKLTNLWSLWLGNGVNGENQISNLTPLSNLTNLRTLVLFRNQISDLSPLSNLTRLQILYLGRNQISDINPLSGLTEMRVLIMHGNQIKDIKPLTNMKFMQVLCLSQNHIEDISPLEGMPHIGELSRIPAWGEIGSHLDLSYNQIGDITPLANNPGIGEGDVVDLRGNPLNAEAYCLHIPALQDRGVKVLLAHI